MDFGRIVRACLTTPRESILDHAETLSLLVQNILLSPAPLYRIAEWAGPISPQALGISNAQKQALNDDRVARALDVLTSFRGRSLFFRLALHIIKRFELDTQRIHQDTTTVTFYGRYAGSFREPRITHGHNKDHRPDLKQLVFGVNITADGAVPVSHQVHSGNRTDDTVHRGNLEELRQLLRRDDFVYVADSKLCTRKNLAQIAGYGGKFVTVAPRTRNEDKEFRRKLRNGIRVRWRQLLVQPSKRRKSDPPDVYWTTADAPTQTQEGYRLVWYRSSQKAESDAEARDNALQKTEAALVELNSRLNRGKLRRRASINKQVKAILHSFDCQELLDVKLRSHVKVKTKYLRPGRPKKGDPVQEVRSYIYRLEVHRDQDALRSEARQDGVFPLVTNLQPRQATKKDVLLIYKYQPYVEKRHALLKSELEVAPVYLKKPIRAVGLVHATFLAMTLDALIERTVRQNMHRQGIEALPILPEGRLSKTPTTARILEMFSGVAWYEFERDAEVVAFPIRLTNLQKELLRLLEIDVSAYA
jgi:transposase